MAERDECTHLQGDSDECVQCFAKHQVPTREEERDQANARD